ncbi:MAG: putative alpha-L-rhamnosidase [Pedosphaera sp.]|nr:putative alpha-L-rhamnosidase [Pedosphaera sp.]
MVVLLGLLVAHTVGFAAVPVLTTNTLPVISADVVGSQVTFFAAFNSDSPVKLQWRKNSGGGPVNIPGATNTVLTLTNLQLSDSASYSLLASNNSGVTISAASSLTVNPIPAPVGNVIVSAASQVGNGSNSFTPTWSVASGNLIAGISPSSVGAGNFSQESAGGVGGLTDGIFGSLATGISGSHPTSATCGGSGGTSITYTLSASATNGYDVTNIVVYGGWNDNGRDQQGYTVLYSTISAPATFIPLTTVNYNPSVPASLQSATRVMTGAASGGLLASNIAKVKFDFAAVAVENGYTGYSEIGLYGTPSIVVARPVANVPTASPTASVSAGTIVTLNEAATGVGLLQYQWQTDNGTGGAVYSDIASATGSNYVVNTASFGNNTLQYRVRVTDANGTTVSPAIFITVTESAAPSGVVARMRCEHLQDPLGIDVVKPRLSWILTSTNRGCHQTAYQVLVASSPAILAQNQGDMWSSGKVVSDQSVLAAYDGQPLVSGRQYYWKVRVWDQDGTASAWSPFTTWSMGLLSPSDWSANWIGMNTDTNILPAPPSPMLRKTFTVSKPVARATAYICGLGYYELQFNGEKVGDHVLDPTWTRYDYQADYVTYDMTTNLLQGQNALGVQLANGFYNQWTTDAWNTYNAPWRALPQMIMQLDVEYTDGTSMRVNSDQTWKASTGPLLLDATRLGEVYDARLEKQGWATASYNDSAWSAAILREGIRGDLIAPNAEPIRIKKTISSVKIIPVSGQPGVYTFDFGQNLVGWGRLSVSGPAGTVVTMVFGEKTNSNGSVDQGNINVYVNSQRTYFQKDIYTLKGGGAEVWEPRFTYHGFRYAQVSGLPSAPTTNTLVARVLNTDFESTGSFLCSSDLLNRIETNTLWSYLGNFVGIPTDCPHREKNGWTGDAQLACEIGLTHFGSAAAYTRWLREFRPEEFASGGYGVLPNAVWGANVGPPWESAYLIIPWSIYQHCGDEHVLTNNYVGMKAYVDYLTSVASGNIVSFGLGDWLPAATTTPTSVTGTVYYYQDALIVARTAALMGNTAESLQYSNLAAQIKTSFNSTFYNSTTKLYSVGSQTAQSAALYFGLANTNQVPAVAKTLADNVSGVGNTVDTGILGSKYLLRALCDNGQSDTALALATQTAYPSWGYTVLSGGTTLWESWNGTGSIDSLNHVMFGDISAWFIQYLAGIRPGAPGYKTVTIKPEIVSGLTWAQATHESPYGTISSAWQLSGQDVNLNITIPPGAVAKVYLPTMGGSATNLVIKETDTTIWQGGAIAASVSGATYDHFEGGGSQTYSVWSVASGSYQFAWNVLPVPNGLTAKAGNRWATLNWKEVPGAMGYNVKRSTASGGPYTTLVSGLNTTNYNDAPLSNSVTWYYVVSAVYSNGESFNSSEASAKPSEILNAGFETPPIGGGYLYTPQGASWNFTGGTDNGSGIAANNSGFTSENPSASEGTQVGFVQSNGAISQILSGFIPGTHYTIAFAAAQRAGGNQHGGESWDVRIDGNVIASFNPGPTATSYVDYAAQFTATAANHNLAFVGTDLATGDNTVFIDNVRVSPSLQPVSATVTLTNPTNNTGLAANTLIGLAATVNSNGNTINSVQFYANTSTLIGTDSSPPYTCIWTNPISGNYRVFARAIFNGGNVSDSGVVNIVVTNLPPVIQGINSIPGGQYFSIGGTGQAGQPVVLMTTADLSAPVLWSPLATNQADANGHVVFSNLAATNQQQFYRLAVP